MFWYLMILNLNSFKYTNYEKSKRTTNRSETTSRADALEYAPAKSIVSALTQAQDPTRNKSDMNLEQYDHINGRAPGINSFIGGVSVTPEMRMLNSQNQGNSEQYGIRTTDKRGKAGRTANGSRMNVRADALNQGGVVTTARVDSNKYDGRMNPVNGGWSQNYTNDSFYQLNPYKGKADPRNTSRGLNIHKQQLANNPFSHSLS